MTIEKTLRDLGRARRERNGILVRMALAVSAAAARNEIDADDANELYLLYYRAATGSAKVTSRDAGVTQQASKLRQIIKAKSPTLVKRVVSACNATSDARPRVYQVIVAACRLQNSQPRALSDRQIMQLVNAKR